MHLLGLHRAANIALLLHAVAVAATSAGRGFLPAPWPDSDPDQDEMAKLNEAQVVPDGGFLVWAQDLRHAIQHVDRVGGVQSEVHRVDAWQLLLRPARASAGKPTISYPT